MSNRVPDASGASEPAEPSYSVPGDSPRRALRRRPHVGAATSVAAFLASAAAGLGFAHPDATAQPLEPERGIVGASGLAQGWAAGPLGGRLPEFAAEHALVPSDVSRSAANGAASQGRVLYEEDFSRPRGWQPTDTASFRLDYLDGELRVLLRQPQLLWMPISLTVDDFAVEASARLSDGASAGSPGLAFGCDPSGGSLVGCHAFAVDPRDGRFMLIRREPDGTIETLVPWTSSEAIARGVERNTLRVERRGSDVRLIVNGATVRRLELAGVQAGRAGMVPLNLGPAAAEILFDFLRLETVDALPTDPPGTPGPDTATPTATRTPTAQPAHTPVHGTTVYHEPFENPRSGWPSGPIGSSGGTGAYRSGRYALSLPNATQYVYIGRGIELIGGAAEVVTFVEPGSLAVVGVFIGGSESAWTIAFFQPASGRYDISLATPLGQVRLASGRAPDGAAAESGRNVLRLEGHPSELRFFVNDVNVATLPGVVAARGVIGIALSPPEAGATVAAEFDDLRQEALVEMPSAPPTPTALPTARLVSRVVDERFDDQAPVWCSASNELVTRDVVDGEHRWRFAGVDPRWVLCGVLGEYAAIDVRVDVRFLPGQEGPQAGLVFGVASDGRSYFRFAIDPVGRTFELSYVDSTGVQTLIEPTVHTAIDAGIDGIEMRVVVQGGWVRLYVNSEELAARQLGAVAGGFGLAGRNPTRPDGAELRFDNMVVQVADPRQEAVPTEPPPGSAPSPSPASVRLPTSSAPPMATVRSTKRVVFLPLAVGAADVPNGGSTVQLAIAFGTGVDERGGLVGRGSQFPVGTRALVGRITSIGTALGLPIRWQWRRDGVPLGAAGLHGRLSGDDGETSFDVWIQAGDGFGLPAGRYLLVVWIGDAVDPFAIAEATVGRPVLESSRVLDPAWGYAPYWKVPVSPSMRSAGGEAP